MKNLSYIYTIIHTLFLLFISLFSAKAQPPITIASFTTTNSTTGLCVPASIEFRIGDWFNNSPGTIYVVDFGDGSKKDTLKHPLNGTNTTYLFSHVYTKASCPTPDFKATLKVFNGLDSAIYILGPIVIRQKPTADFGVPSTCTNIPVCFTNQTKNAFTDNSCSITGNFTWDFGDGTTSNAATPPCHTYTVAGTYDVTLKVSNTACGDDSKTKQITVGPLSPSPVVTTPVLYCQGKSPVPLNATGTGVLWYTAATGGVGSATAPIPSTTTAGTKTYYVTQTLPGHCESLRVPVTVTVYALPSRPVVTTPVNLCLDQLAVPLTATGTNLLWYMNATGAVGSSTAPTPSTINAGNTTYYVSQTNSNGCESPLANIVVIVHPVPSKPAITAKTPLCIGDDLVLQAYSSIEGNATLNYSWEGPGIDFPANASNVGIADIKKEDGGIYKITATAAGTGCSATADTLIQVGDFPVVKFAQDTVILPSNYPLNLSPLIINANEPGVSPIQNYVWTPSDDLIYKDAIRSSAIATVKANTCYAVTATNIYGCSGRDDICVKILCRNVQVFIPTAFTPAGNVPENRRLTVRTVGGNMVRSFRVFNRWGKTVFERNNFPSNDPAFGWNGQFNGKIADAGVYVYTVDVICENGVPYSFKGNVTLL